MNVAVERLPESQVVLDISTDEQEFSKALDRAYRKVVNQVRLPGFRPGKAPRRIVEQLLGREVLVEQADRDLLDPLYQQALERESLNPVSEPDVEIYQVEPLAFKVTVQIYPAIEPGDYAGVRVEPRPVAIGDEQIDEAIERLRKSRSPWQEPVEPRPAGEGDRVTLDVTVREAGGEADYRDPLTDSVFVLGQDNLFPQLRDAIAGMNVGDTKTVEVAFAEGDEAAEAGMRGKTFDYGLTLKKIEEQHLLPLDDDFAGTVSDGKIATLDALRADIRKDLLRAERQKARTELGGEIVNRIGEGADFAIPAVMVDKQIDSEVENLRNHLAQDHGQTLEDHLRLEDKTLEALREELRPEAARRLRNSLVLREIATREGVSVTPQDIDAEIDRMVGLVEDQERMRQIYSGNYIRNLLENELFERKLMDKVIDLATGGRGAFDPPESADEAAGEPDPAGDTESASGEMTAPTLASADDGGEGAMAGTGERRAEPDPAEAATAGQGATAPPPPAGETGGILPEDKSITIGEGEAVARSETYAPDADEDRPAGGA